MIINKLKQLRFRCYFPSFL